jgi:hypothetical protein
MSNPYIVTLWVGEVGYKYSIDLKGVYYKYPCDTAYEKAHKLHKDAGRGATTVESIYHGKNQC